MYEVVFTRGFKNQLEKMPRRVITSLGRQIEWIRNDPFARHPNLARLQGAPHEFRASIGDVRSLYRVFTKQRRVVFYHIDWRGNVYKGPVHGGSELPPDESARVFDEIQGTQVVDSTHDLPAPRVGAINPEQELRVVVEHLSWICEDELYLLNIPGELWSTILNAGSLEGLYSIDIDEDLRWRIEDYWTNPAPSHVEKLYILSSGQALEAIAQLPLEHFVIALDPEQKQALQKLKDEGPYLIKGSAGTGKTLLGLYHIRDMILARAGESLFDDGRALFGVVTYTNTLAEANDALLKAITPSSVHGMLRCTTLDKIAYDLAARELKCRPGPLSIEGAALWIEQIVMPQLHGTAAELSRRLGSHFLATEIEQVIIGNGLESVGEYMEFERRGRKRGLRKVERRDIWTIYEQFRDVCVARKVQTFEQIRSIARRYLKDNPTYPRFAVLFVDEAQDFSREARRLCMELVRDPKHLVVAADTAQSIYTIPSSWRSVDVRFDFRRRRPIMLERSYRTTQEIGRAIASLRLDPGDEDDRSSDAVPVFSGPKPRWIEVPLRDHVRVVAEEVEKIVRQQEQPVNAGQVAIIVRDARRAHRFRAALRQRSIKTRIIDRETPLEVSGEGVHIITAHSAKGLTFPFVFVPDVHEKFYPWHFAMQGIRDEQHKNQILDEEQRLLYVAMARACYSLAIVVASDAPSPFVKKLDRDAHWSA